MDELIRPARKGSRWTTSLKRPYLVCRVTPGNRWWDIDDEVRAIPGRRDADKRGSCKWHAVPANRLPDLQMIAERNPGRLIVHRAP